jgi:CRP-like cAMP-binding protein
MGNFQDMGWFELLSSQSTEKSYKRGESLNLLGQSFKTVGFVVSGKASALSYSIDGDETWAGEYNEGQFIGLMSLFAHDASDFEVQATSKLVLRVLPQDKFMELMRNDAALCEAIARDLATQLNKSMSDFVNVHTLSVRGRICAELMRLSSPIGLNPERHIIRPSPIFVEVARRLNSSRETVSRTVSELQDRGVISRRPGALIVESPHRLQAAIQKL